MGNHKTPRLTVDGIIIEKGSVLLVRRNIEPFKGCWVLPGGHVEYGERVEDAITREMKEELGISVRIKRLTGVYSDPNRDPRGHVVSTAFLLERTGGEIAIDWEASEYHFFPLEKLPRKIGFDHREIISDARKASRGLY